MLGVVALSTALITVVICTTSSVDHAIAMRMSRAVGAADLKLKHIGEARFPNETIELVRSWPETSEATPIYEAPTPLRHMMFDNSTVVVGVGVDLETYFDLRPLEVLEGRVIERDGEILLEKKAARELDVAVGDAVLVQRWGAPLEFKVVGIAASPPLGLIGRARGFMTSATLQEASSEVTGISEIDVVLGRGVDAEQFVQRYASSVPPGVVMEPTARVASGLEDRSRTTRIMMLVMAIFTFLCASFIIMTGLATGVVERERELAVIRCIGGSRAQLAASQMLIGGGLGLMGGVVGAPLGVLVAYVGGVVFREQLPTGISVPPVGIALAAVGAVVAGLIGAGWPALAAARMSPLQGLAVRARTVRSRTILMLGCVGLALVFGHMALTWISDDGDFVWWSHAMAGLPMTLIGYALLGVPIVLLLSMLIGRPIERALGLPRRLVVRSIRSTPLKHGFTAGSLMAGLSVMIAIWTQGAAALRDYVGSMNFPDAVVNGLGGLTEDQRRQVDLLPYVEDSCAVTMQTVGVESFGIRGINPLDTTFIGFEVEPFFRMTSLEWVEGDQEQARQALERGGAVIVAREFLNAQNKGVGEFVELEHDGRKHAFEIVGVINSPGLEIVSKFFSVGEVYRRQAAHAVFGTREEMKRIFGNDAINMIQLSLAEDIEDEVAVEEIRQALGGSLLMIVSGREIKRSINSIGGGFLRMMSALALAAITISCFGVANTVVAGIDARRFEFGVLRSLGAEGGTLARIVVAEVLVVATTACVLGLLMGHQLAITGVRLQRLILGLDVRMQPSALAILIGCVVVFALALLAGTPAALRLARRSPRELLAAR